MTPLTTPAELGRLIRRKRKARGLTQDALAARCGVGTRFIVELEAGKPTCQIGKALLAAIEVGIVLADTAPDAARDAAKHAADKTAAAPPGPADAAAAVPLDDDPLAALPKF